MNLSARPPPDQGRVTLGQLFRYGDNTPSLMYYLQVVLTNMNHEVPLAARSVA